MRDARPFFQLVHLGDLGMLAPDAARDRGLRVLERLALRGIPAARTLVEAARTRHDPFALDAMVTFLEAICIRDPIFRRLPAWVVHTGSRTRFGDAASFALARAQLRRVATAAVAAERIDLAGASDGGPDAPVAFVPERWPAPPCIARALGGRIEVQLYAVSHRNALLDGDSASRLRAAMLHYAPADGVKVVRIVASPRAIAGVPTETLPAVHLALTSGAAHSHAESCIVPVLVAPPASHRATRSVQAPAQTLTLLRFHASPSHRDAVLVERLVAERTHGIGPYRFVANATGEALAEEYRLQITE